MKSLKLLILTLLICLPAQAAQVSDFVNFSLLSSPGQSVLLPGRLYVPPSAASGPRPLIVFLHGSGAAGTNNSSQVNASIDNLLAEAKLRGAFLYAPQTATTWAGETVTDQVMTMIARAKTDYNVVATQVYMTGISMGGGGAWNMLSRYGSEFAAGLPICGVGVAADYLAANLVGKPIWAFHGKLDTSVNISYSRSRVNGILTANGQQTQIFNSDPVDEYFNWATLRLQYTEFGNEEHSIWDRVYSTTAVYDWLFSQNLPQLVQVMRDDFTDADRAGWFEVDDGTSTLSVNQSSPISGGGNSLAFDTTDLGMQTFATHFAPVTLAESGDSVTLEFKARRTGTGFQNRGFRFGLYQSGAQPFTADADQDQALISLEDAGYFAVIDSGASVSDDSAVLRRDISESSGSGTNDRLFNGTTLASADNGAGDDPLMFSPDKDFTYVLSITRVGDSLKLLLENDETLAAGSGSLAFTETAPATYTFDTLYFGQRATTAGGANFVIDDVCVSKIIDPGTDVNEAPSAGDGAGSVSENTAAGAAITTVVASDPDAGDVLSYAITAGNTGGAFAINSSTGAITTAAALNREAISQYVLIVTVTDSGLLSDTATITIGVTNVNEAPLFTANPITGAAATEGSAYSGSLAGSASDVDAGDALAFSKVSGPAWLSVAANGTLSGTPGNSNVGSNNFVVRVTDAGGLSADAAFNVTVAVLNDAPVFAANPINLNGTEDSAFTGQLVASDADAGDTLTYSKVFGPAWLAVSSTGALSGTPGNSQVGANNFVVQVNDGTVSVTAALNITVANVNDAPVFTSNPMTRANGEEGVAYTGQTLAGAATDADAGDSITYSKVSGAAWLMVAADGTLSGTPPLGSAGLNAFVVRATDSNSATADATLNITVTGLPLPWVTGDIGTGMLAGSATYSAGTFTQAGSGTISGKSDLLRYAYQTLSGDGEIIARVSVLQDTGNSSRVGVMIRDTLATNSRQVFMGLASTGDYRWVRRTSTGGNASTTNSSTGTVPNTGCASPGWEM
jgi:predicted esterase